MFSDENINEELRQELRMKSIKQQIEWEQRYPNNSLNHVSTLAYNSAVTAKNNFEKTIDYNNVFIKKCRNSREAYRRQIKSQEGRRNHLRLSQKFNQSRKDTNAE